MRFPSVFLVLTTLTLGARSAPIEWFEAARMGDWPMIERQLANGANINQTDYSGMTALHHALALRQTDTVRRLLSHGSDPAKASTDHSTLEWAIFGGDLDAFRLLLDDVRSKSRDSGRLFQSIISFGRAAFLDELDRRGTRLRKGAELDDALAAAVRSEYPVLVERLLRLGANPNRQAGNGEFPLTRAAFLGRVDLIDLLLRGGARIDASGNDIDGMFPTVTALDLAILADQRAATVRLLAAGADPRGSNNRPLILADLIGDAKLRDALVRAGAKPPRPFAFAQWMPEGKAVPLKREDGTTAAHWGRQLTEMGVFRSFDPSSDALAGRKLAVIANGAGMRDAEALLTARLSAGTGAILLERGDVQRIARERNLQALLGMPDGASTAGRLLGADVLIILREHTFDSGSLREAKVVAVDTGLVVGTTFSGGKTTLETWVDQTLTICRAAGPLLSDGPEDALIVSVPRVVASLNTALGRELERQLTVTLAAQLGRLPRVVLVERTDIDRLALEKEPSASNYAASAWLMDAVLDLPRSTPGRVVSLRVTLKNRSSSAGHTLQVEGSLDDLAALVKKTVGDVGALFSNTPAEPWAPIEEGAAFLKKAEQFKKAFLWADVASAIEAARALGLEDDAVTGLRMEAAVQRILHSSQRLIDKKRHRRAYGGIAGLVSYRAALLMPIEDSRELDFEGYLDHANLALDIFAASLARPAEKMAGMPFSRWVCGEFWDAATVPLRLSEPLSYQDEYGDELRALRARLLELNDQAATLAYERGDVIAYQTLLGIRLKHLAFWLPDETIFQNEMRMVLSRARDWRPPLSAQSVWSSAYETARQNTLKINGRAGQAWIRLAEALSNSDLPDERYLGICLLGMETLSPGHHWDSIRSLRELFTEVNRLDRGVVTEMYEIGTTLSDYPHRVVGCRNWYGDAFRGLLNQGSLGLDYRGLWGESAWSIKGQNGRYAPEFRAFMFEQAILRAETIGKGAPGGLIETGWTESQGFTPVQLTQIGRSFAMALPVIEALRTTDRSMEYAIDRARSLAATRGKDTPDVSKDVSLVLAPVRNPFVSEVPVKPAQRRGLSINLIGGRHGPESGGWRLLHRTTHEETSGQYTFTAYLYQFDASGNPVRFQRIPDLPHEAVTNGDNLSANERWLVVAGHRPNPEAKKIDDVWFVADMRRTLWRWRVIDAASTGGYLSGGMLVGDHYVYPFVSNPTGPNSGGPDEYETKGDPVFGVIDIDLAAGSEVLIASSRRQPAVTPVESEQIAPFKRIQQVSASGIQIQGKRKKSRYIYDTLTGTWGPMSGASEVQRSPDWISRENVGSVEIDGLKWTFAGEIRAGWLTVSNRRKEEIRIPVILPKDEDLSAYEEYRRAIEQYTLGKNQPILLIDWQPGGGVISLGSGFYHWLPNEQMRDVIRRNLQAGSLKTRISGTR